MDLIANSFKALLLFVTLSSIAQSKPLELWISSFQDQVYYEKMAEMFAKKSKGFELEVKAYGFPGNAR
jgi:hypothetical protein